MSLTSSTNIYSSAVFIVDNVVAGSPYTTVQSAIDAAVAAGGNATVFIRRGTYTEDLTLYTTVEIKGQQASLAIIVGTHTPPAAGKFSFSNIGLNSATHIFSSAVAGTALLNCFSCKFNLTNGYIFNLTNWTAKLTIRQCTDASTANGIAVNTADAPINIVYSIVGKGLTQVMTMSGNVTAFASGIECPLLLNGTGVSVIDSACSLYANITTADTHSLIFAGGRLVTGAVQAITHNSTSTLTLEGLTINSSNAYAIGGTGSVDIMSITFPDSEAINPTVTILKTGVTRTAEIWADNITRMEFSGFYEWDAAGPYFDDTTLGSFEVLIAGTGYVQGRRVMWAGAQTVSGMTAGNSYLIYMDETGTIGKTDTETAALFTDNIVLFACMRDSTPGTNIQVTVKHNLGYDFPTSISHYLGETVGTVIEGSSGGANITLNGTQKIQINGVDVLNTHGLTTTIPDSAAVGVDWKRYYTDGAGKWAEQNDSDTFTGYYNLAGTATVLGAGKYGVYRLYVCKDNLNVATPTYFAVLHTAQFNNQGAAETAINNNEIAATSGELKDLEMAQLGYIIYDQGATAIVSVIIEKTTLRSTTSTSGTNIASGVNTDVSAFDGILSAADSNVQSALDTIDDWGKTATDHGVLIGQGVNTPVVAIVGSTGETVMGATGADPAWTGSPSFSGTATAGTGLTATTGNLIVTAGNLALPVTNAAGTEGEITFGGLRYISNYGSYNIFVGRESGNTSLTTATALRNAGFGYSTLSALTVGPNNLASGYYSSHSITSGSSNTSVGFQSLWQVLSGGYNIALGQNSGSLYTGAESSNIVIGNAGTVGESNVMRLGTDGTGIGQQDTTVIAGTNLTLSGAASAGTVNIATGAGVKATTLGSTNSTSSTAVRSGTGTLSVYSTNGSMNIYSGTGNLTISGDAAATTVNVGTGAAAKTVTVGSTNTTSKLDLKYGTADFTLASASGTVMQALDTGEVTMPLQPAFSAYHSADVANVTGDGTSYNCPFDTEYFDRNSDFNTGTAQFTAPVTGIYHFDANISVGTVAAGHTLGQARLITTSATFYSLYSDFASSSASNGIYICAGTWLALMTAGDTAYLQIGVFNSTKTVSYYATTGNAIFSGFLVS